MHMESNRVIDRARLELSSTFCHYDASKLSSKSVIIIMLNYVKWEWYVISINMCHMCDL